MRCDDDDDDDIKVSRIDSMGGNKIIMFFSMHECFHFVRTALFNDTILQFAKKSFSFLYDVNVFLVVSLAVCCLLNCIVI